MLSIDSLTLGYGQRPVLKEVSLQIGAGEICTLIGPSGCGKTTLLKAIAGLCQADSGAILYQGQPVTAKKHAIGYIPQHYGLLPWKTVEQNITMALKIRKLPLVVDGKPVAGVVLARMGLEGHAKKFPGALSGGQRQRVAIARAFVLEPDILLMDEPFSALDGATKEAMQQFFLDIWEGRDGCTLFITHDIEEAVFLGDKVGIMLPGEPINYYTCPKGGRDTEGFVALCHQLRTRLREAGSYGT
ncbi:MAG: ABC transporter ATP-binding protein [Turicibacter sp.]|nr:ABC transporter ATP-binding protein [Turicibacter sp.]